MSIPYTPVTINGKTYSAALITTELQKIQTALEEGLSRIGTSPNQLEAILDMNSYSVVNLKDAENHQDAVTLRQLEDAIFGNADFYVLQVDHDADIASQQVLNDVLYYRKEVVDALLNALSPEPYIGDVTAYITQRGFAENILSIPTETLLDYRRFRIVAGGTGTSLYTMQVGKVNETYAQIWISQEAPNSIQLKVSAAPNLLNVKSATVTSTSSAAWMITLTTWDGGNNWFKTADSPNNKVNADDKFDIGSHNITNRAETSEPDSISGLATVYGSGSVGTFYPANWGTLLSTTVGYNPASQVNICRTGVSTQSFPQGSSTTWSFSFFVDTTDVGGVDVTYGTDYKVQTVWSATLYDHTLVQDNSVATGVANVFHHTLTLTHDTNPFMDTYESAGIVLGSIGLRSDGSAPLYNGFHYDAFLVEPHKYIRTGRA